MLSKLIQLQVANGWPDAEVARRLGCGRSTWTEVRNGRLPMSARLQMAAAGAFPELLGDLLRTVSASPTSAPEPRAVA
jgi:transcriptional regulator with XRE-family HTH domain